VEVAGNHGPLGQGRQDFFSFRSSPQSRGGLFIGQDDGYYKNQVIRRRVAADLIKKKGRKLMPEIEVKGMSCAHCVAAMTKAMTSLAGVSNVKVDLARGLVSYDSAAPIPPEELARVVNAAGFELLKS
jgi:copper chaperone